jgi:hypothetical protein
MINRTLILNPQLPGHVIGLITRLSLVKTGTDPFTDPFTFTNEERTVSTVLKRRNRKPLKRLQQNLSAFKHRAEATVLMRGSKPVLRPWQTIQASRSLNSGGKHLACIHVETAV